MSNKPTTPFEEFEQKLIFSSYFQYALRDTNTMLLVIDDYDEAKRVLNLKDSEDLSLVAQMLRDKKKAEKELVKIANELEKNFGIYA